MMCLALLCWHPISYILIPINPMHPEPQSVCLIWRPRLGFVCNCLIVHLKANCKGLHLAALQMITAVSRVVSTVQ